MKEKAFPIAFKGFLQLKYEKIVNTSFAERQCSKNGHDLLKLVPGSFSVFLAIKKNNKFHKYNNNNKN